MSIDLILYDPLSFDVHITQIGLGTGIPLFGSKSVPFHRSLIILWNTLSVVIHHTQIVLGIGPPLFGKKFPFTESSCEVTTFGSGKALLEITRNRRW